jgi:hypothetical protein
MDYIQIFPKLTLGSCPEDAADVEVLHKELGITAVLNLQTDEDFSHLELDWNAICRQYVRT